MTSKLKCPVCQKPLEQVGTSRQYQCGTWGCDASFDMIGTEALWAYLIQAKQDLVIGVRRYKLTHTTYWYFTFLFWVLCVEIRKKGW